MITGYVVYEDGESIPLKFLDDAELKKFRETLADVVNDDGWLRIRGFKGKRYEPDSAEIARRLYSEMYKDRD